MMLIGSKVMQCRKVPGAIKAILKTKGFRLEFARLLHENMLIPTLVFGSNTLI